MHEQQQEPAPAAAPETESKSVATSAPETAPKTEKVEKTELPAPPAVSEVATTKKEQESSSKKTSATTNGNSQRRSNARRNTAAVGTGASLLNRKARGAVQGGTFIRTRQKLFTVMDLNRYISGNKRSHICSTFSCTTLLI